VRLQDGFSEKRKADRESGGYPLPPQRGDRPVHFLIAEPAYTS
jgi:hypothetical protein